MILRMWCVPQIKLKRTFLRNRFIMSGFVIIFFHIIQIYCQWNILVDFMLMFCNNLTLFRFVEIIMKDLFILLLLFDWVQKLLWDCNDWMILTGWFLREWSTDEIRIKWWLNYLVTGLVELSDSHFLIHKLIF